MAASYASSATVNFALANPVVTKPTGLSVGDTMVGLVASVDNSAASLSLPGGWTVIDSDSTGGESWKAGYKVADAGDVAASNFTFTGTGDYTGAAIARVTGSVIATLQSSKQKVTGGAAFNTADITPTYANSLFLFFVISFGTSTGASAYAMTTSNPTWTQAFTFGSTAPATDMAISMGYANRPEITSSGDFSATASGDNHAFIVVLAPQVSATVAAPSPASVTINIPAASASGKAMVTAPNPATMTININAVTPTVVEDDWTNTSKNNGTWTNLPKS